MNNISNILCDLIRIQTDDKTKSNKLFVDYICKILSEHNIMFERILNHSGIQESIIAGMNVPALENINTGLVLSGHMDTVAANPADWACNPFQGQLINNEIYGRGTVDMKYFIAVVLSLLPELKSADFPIFLAFSCDEETDVTGVQTLTTFLQERHIHPQYALIGEPTHFDLCVSNRGYIGYQTVVKGISAHSGSPELGVNAAYIAAQIVSKIEELNNRYTPRGTTLNVGVLHGGEGRNSIPSRLSIDWEIRYVRETDKNEILSEIQTLKTHLLEHYTGADISSLTTEYLPPFERRDNGVLIDTVQHILGTNTFDLPYATEAGFFQSIGIETLICGAGNEQLAHCANERIHVNDLTRYQQFLIDFIHEIKPKLNL